MSIKRHAYITISYKSRYLDIKKAVVSDHLYYRIWNGYIFRSNG